MKHKKDKRRVKMKKIKETTNGIKYVINEKRIKLLENQYNALWEILEMISRSIGFKNYEEFYKSKMKLNKETKIKLDIILELIEKTIRELDFATAFMKYKSIKKGDKNGQKRTK